MVFYQGSGRVEQSDGSKVDASPVKCYRPLPMARGSLLAGEAGAQGHSAKWVGRGGGKRVLALENERPDVCIEPNKV